MYVPLHIVQSPAKPVNSQLAQQVREMQHKVVQLEQERLSAMSRADAEKELQIQVHVIHYVALHSNFVCTLYMHM